MKGLPMSIQSRTVSARHSKVRAEKKRKTKQVAIRIVTHGIANEKESICVWNWVAFDDVNNIVASDCGVRGNGYGVTCNSAKFHGVIEALGWLAVNLPDKPVTVFCDVKFIVSLVNGLNKAHFPHLKLLCLTAQQFLSRTKATLEWKRNPRSKRAVLSSRKASRKDFSKAERISHDSNS
jgi:ribonuclease HI